MNKQFSENSFFFSTLLFSKPRNLVAKILRNLRLSPHALFKLDLNFRKSLYLLTMKFKAKMNTIVQFTER